MGRVRNRNGAKDPILRPKRLGQARQQPLLDLESMVDWLRAGVKHGWLAATRGDFEGYAQRVSAVEAFSPFPAGWKAEMPLGQEERTDRGRTLIWLPAVRATCSPIRPRS